MPLDETATPSETKIAHGKRGQLTALLVGELPINSSPLLTLSRALQPWGVRTIFSERTEFTSTSEWLRLVRTSDVVIFLGYRAPEPFLLRQLALAASLGKHVLRWWVGSDVLFCLENPQQMRWVKLADTLFVQNIAVAPHLQEELADVGLSATMIPSLVVPGFVPVNEPLAPLPPHILVYLPTERASFYGATVIASVIEANPDLRFVVVADANHLLKRYQNVESLGWVQDMRSLYNRVGCLLRMTRHDGLPRMVIESLLLGKYVIYRHELPGCWRANNFEEAQQWISAFRKCTSPNMEGSAAIKSFLTPPPEDQFAENLNRIVREQHLAVRIRAALAIVPLTVRARLHKAAAFAAIPLAKD